jgi:hypothetical protein
MPALPCRAQVRELQMRTPCFRAAAGGGGVGAAADCGGAPVSVVHSGLSSTTAWGLSSPEACACQLSGGDVIGVRADTVFMTDTPGGFEWCRYASAFEI